jgi:hypothetical protein
MSAGVRGFWSVVLSDPGVTASLLCAFEKLGYDCGRFSPIDDRRSISGIDMVTFFGERSDKVDVDLSGREGLCSLLASLRRRAVVFLADDLCRSLVSLSLDDGLGESRS